MRPSALCLAHRRLSVATRSPSIKQALGFELDDVEYLRHQPLHHVEHGRLPAAGAAKQQHVDRAADGPLHVVGGKNFYQTASEVPRSHRPGRKASTVARDTGLVMAAAPRPQSVNNAGCLEILLHLEVFDAKTSHPGGIDGRSAPLAPGKIINDAAHGRARPLRAAGKRRRIVKPPVLKGPDPTGLDTVLRVAE